MSDSQTQIELLKEIRDVLSTQAEKYDRYVKQAESYNQAQRKQQSGFLFWLCFAVMAGVFFGSILAHGAGLR